MRTYFAAFLITALAAGACAQPAPAPKTPPETPNTSQRQEHQLIGQILDLSLETNQALIKHQDIGEVMAAMTMPFRVEDPKLLTTVKPGDLITATVVIEDGRTYLSAIAVTGSAPLPPEFTGVPTSPGVQVLETGDEAPDTALTGQDGAEIRLSGWRGRVVVLTFIYTRSRLPDFAPAMDRLFGEIQTGLAQDPSLGDRVQLLSVSLDPERDTSKVLKAHAASLGADTRRWRFATAPAAIVDRLAAEFGVTVGREKDGTIAHNLRTAVIGPDGRVAALYPGNTWTAAQALGDVRKALASAP